MAQWGTGSLKHVYIYVGDPSGEARKSCNAGSVQLHGTRRTLGDMQLYSPALSCPAGHRAGGVLDTVGKKKNCSSDSSAFSC